MLFFEYWEDESAGWPFEVVDVINSRSGAGEWVTTDEEALRDDVIGATGTECSCEESVSFVRSMRNKFWFGSTSSP